MLFQVPCHDLRELGNLKACEIYLGLEGRGAMVEFLKQLPPLPLHTLAITATKLSIQEQRLLSRCRVGGSKGEGTLALNLGPGNSYLKFVPKGCKIIHSKMLV